MAEHKLFVKYQVQGEVLIQLTGAKLETVRAELVDFSFKGYDVYSPKPIEVNSIVKFFISGKFFEKHLRGEGKIMYCKVFNRKGVDVYSIGVEFTSVHSGQVRDIHMRLQEELNKNPAGNT